MATAAQISAAMRQQIDACLGRANGFVEHPQTMIDEAKISGVSPSGTIGHVALAIAATNPPLAANLKAIAEEIDAIALAYDAERLSPSRNWSGAPDRLRHLVDMIATVRIDHLRT